MSSRIIEILLVEDDEIDAEVIVRAFQKQKISNPLTIVPSGVEALATLRGKMGYTRLSRPYLILLDINMPRMNGIEFLKELRQDQELRRSVVFVLTTSDRDEDKQAAYDAQVAGYVLKSKVGSDFTNVLTLLKSYELIVELP